MSEDASACLLLNGNLRITFFLIMFYGGCLEIPTVKIAISSEIKTKTTTETGKIGTETD